MRPSSRGTSVLSGGGIGLHFISCLFIDLHSHSIIACTGRLQLMCPVLTDLLTGFLTDQFILTPTLIVDISILFVTLAPSFTIVTLIASFIRAPFLSMC